MFEAVDGAAEIRGNEIMRTFAVSGMCAWFRGAFNQEIDRPHGFEVLGRAHVTVMKVDTERTQPLYGKLTATPFQVIERHDVPVRMISAERDRETGPDEPSAPGYHQAKSHGPPQVLRGRASGQIFRRSAFLEACRI